MRADQAIDALPAGIVGAFLHPRLEARVVDEKGQVRVGLGHGAHFARGAKLGTHPVKRHALVHRECPHPKLSCMVESACGQLAVEGIAGTVRAPLRVELPRRNLVPGLPLHRLDLARQIGEHAAVDQCPVRTAAHRLDEAAGPRGVGDRRWISVVSAEQGRDDPCVGVAVEEHLLHQRLGRIAVIFARRALPGLREGLAERGAPLLAGRAFGPAAFWIHRMQLHVEDELVAGQRLGGGGIVERRVPLQRIIAARTRVGPVARRQHGRRAHTAGQEGTPPHAEPTRIFGRCLMRHRIGRALVAGQAKRARIRRWRCRRNGPEAACLRDRDRAGMP